MKLQFDSTQDYQLEAMRAVVDVFEGQPLGAGTTATAHGLSNQLLLSEEQVLANLRRVQARHGLPLSAQLARTAFGKGAEKGHIALNLTVEMETGTGKTYTYLRTVYELHRQYGFRKFVVVVPSVAIREGTLKNLAVTHEHLQALYGRPPITFGGYDSGRLGVLRNYASSDALQVLVLNIDAFARDSTVINTRRESGVKPIEYIQRMRPVVIVDEPQNMETDVRRAALANLNPLCLLRYSATHRHLYDLVYSLNPVQAYDRGLVKQIVVDGITGGPAPAPLGAGEIMKFQVEQTVLHHFRRLQQLQPRGIKELSLFFIDRVANYRGTDADGQPTLGKLGQWFEAAFRHLASAPEYAGLIPFEAEQVHAGYFSQDKKGPRDTTGTTKADDDTYALIMRNKEQLLSPLEPVQFIFSHSALREGWDNPNVFQICTLSEAKTTLRKRQEIGRGLRLPVNAQGLRVRDASVNLLTIIANESYDSFARALQAEIEEETSVNFAGRIQNAREVATVYRTRELTPDAAPLFFELWDRIKHQSRYRVRYDSAELIRRAVAELRDLGRVPRTVRPRLRSEVAQLEMSVGAGVTATRRAASDAELATAGPYPIPDVYAYIQQRVDLTRATIFEVLKQSERYAELEINPQLFLDNVVDVLRRTLQQLMVDEVQYERLPGQEFSLALFDQEEGPTFRSNLFEMQRHPEKTVFNYVAVANARERAIAHDLEADERVQYFFKLPRGFAVPTPVGSYVPTWAVLLQGNPRVCVVADTTTLAEPQPSGVQGLNIACGRRHFALFAAEGIRFETTTQASELVNLSQLP